MTLLSLRRTNGNSPNPEPPSNGQRTRTPGPKTSTNVARRLGWYESVFAVLADRAAVNECLNEPDPTTGECFCLFCSIRDLVNDQESPVFHDRLVGTLIRQHGHRMQDVLNHNHRLILERDAAVARAEELRDADVERIAALAEVDRVQNVLALDDQQRRDSDELAEIHKDPYCLAVIAKGGPVTAAEFADQIIVDPGVEGEDRKAAVGKAKASAGAAAKERTQVMRHGLESQRAWFQETTAKPAGGGKAQKAWEFTDRVDYLLEHGELRGIAKHGFDVREGARLAGGDLDAPIPVAPGGPVVIGGAGEVTAGDVLAIAIEETG